MNKFFGEYFYPVFTPPWNRYDGYTIKILNDLDFKILSVGFHGIPKEFDENFNFKFIPTSIDFNRIDSENNFSEEFNRLKNKTRIIGILLHHETFDSGKFKLLEDIISRLKKDKKTKIVSLSKI